ncbi:MAG: hypothetical protein FJ387_26155 [Verrucomicrobia bacterium]|nr:hypothetical protein [Verrucomicrobiota bacterium]
MRILFLTHEKQMWEIRRVRTLTVDDQKRVWLPDARPRQVFAYEPAADGSIRLLPVDAVEAAGEVFPRGSLLQWLTPEAEAETAALARASSLQ